MDVKLAEAISTAHRAAECADYYCGCWDGWLGDEEGNARYDLPMWRHTTKFLAALKEQGYEVVTVADGRARPS